MINETITKKVKFFCENKLFAHIKLINKRFLNAYFVESKTDSIWIIKERKLGLMHLFLDDVIEIEEYLGGKEYD